MGLFENPFGFYCTYRMYCSATMFDFRLNYMTFLPLFCWVSSNTVSSNTAFSFSLISAQNSKNQSRFRIFLLLESEHLSRVLPIGESQLALSQGPRVGDDEGQVLLPNTRKHKEAVVDGELDLADDVEAMPEEEVVVPVDRAAE
jgi:hypothetical protein